ncbi:hypothetical protein EBR57_03185 [bacterium]|jgi:hypothetical protein|nr:hypothetical protein [bacterium]
MLLKNRSIEGKTGTFYVTHEQYNMLWDIYLRMGIDKRNDHATFGDFLRSVQQEFAPMEQNKPVPILVPFYGMVVGIELDGYTHS